MRLELLIHVFGVFPSIEIEPLRLHALEVTTIARESKVRFHALEVTMIVRESSLFQKFMMLIY